MGTASWFMQSRSGVASETARVQITYAAIVFTAALSLYGWTLAPTVTLVDSGELIVAARSLGVAHPPGFPLYVILAHVASLLPIGDIAVRVNFASALFGALAAAVGTLIVTELLLNRRSLPSKKRHPRRKEKGKPKQPSPESKDEGSRSGSWLMLAPALLSGLLLAFSRTLWSYSTIAEVYSLNTLLIGIVILLLLRRARRSAQRLEETRDSLLYAAALVFGLALGVHHVSVGLTLPALAVLVYAQGGVRLLKGKRLVYAALLVVAGLSIYAYLPLAASRSPVMNWGDARTLERFWWHVSGRQYQVFFSPSVETMLRQFREFIRLAGREFGPWWLPVGMAVAALGLGTTFKRDKTTFWFLSLIVLANLPYALNYEIAEDKDAYYLPTFFAMSLAAGLGMDVVARAAESKRLFSSLPGTVPAALLLVPIISLLSSLPYNNRRQYFIAHDYVDNILATTEPRGMVLTIDWQVYSPMLYVLEIEKRRPDVIAIDLNQLRRSWYFDHLSRSYPELMEKTRAKVEAFLGHLRRWEQDPDLYDRDNALNQGINTSFNEMILAFIGTQIQTAPVYLTQELVVGADGQYRDLTKALEASYQFVPQGLLFELTATRDFYNPSHSGLLTRGLADGTIRFDREDVVSVKVLPAYLAMIVNRGRYLAVYGRHEQAIEAFNEALALAPSYTPAQRLRDQSELALRRPQSSDTK
jgi:tetratricopeptide (TPR) repeat protein